MSAKNKTTSHPSSLEKEDFYYNNDGLVVFTAAYLLKRGYCCKYGCKHCPFSFGKQEEEDPGDKN